MTRQDAGSRQQAVLANDMECSRVGKGFTGAVFQVPGAKRVIKKAHTKGDLNVNLWNDRSLAIGLIPGVLDVPDFRRCAL